MKPWLHAISSAKQFGGKPEDYLPIHDCLDSSKGVIADNRHRALTHNAWFLSVMLEQIFGTNITNSDGKLVSVRSIGEQHVGEDFGGFIPAATDFLQEMEIMPWMVNGKGVPPSCARLYRKRKPTKTNTD